MTRHENDYECRVINCRAEDWMKSIYGSYPEKDICKYCPFQKYINTLAEKEDMEEKNTDDLK